jgi:hypothetical protein
LSNGESLIDGDGGEETFGLLCGSGREEDDEG